MALKTFFPTYVWSERPKLSSLLIGQLTEECYSFRELDRAGRKWSAENYPHGYTSYSSICDLHRRSPRFATLRRALDRAALSFARRLDLDLKNHPIELSTLWINIMEKGAQHSYHLHPLSVLSGTFYLHVPRGSPGLKLEDPRIASFMASPPRGPRVRTENLRYLELPCRAGQLVLFESWLKHEVPVNQSSGDRISVSFNYDRR